MSPLGIVLSGAGAAAGIVVGLRWSPPAGVGALAWGGRVLGRRAAGPPSARVPATSLSEPWRSYAIAGRGVQAALRPGRRVGAGGPLRERLQQLSGRLDEGIDESWRIARRGHEIVGAIGQIDTTSAQPELAELRRSIGDRQPTPAQAQTVRRWRPSWRRRSGWAAGRRQPRPAAPARRPLRRARRPHRRGQRRLRRHRRPRQRRRRPRQRAGEPAHRHGGDRPAPALAAAAAMTL